MAEHGGEATSTRETPRSRLYDYDYDYGHDHDHMEAAGAGQPAPGTPAASAAPAPPEHAAAVTDATEAVERRRREFATLLGEFRRAAVLVPVDETGAPLTGDQGGIRWIYAFSDEAALARFALARGEGEREWAYQRCLGARLLDAGVRAAGVPCGVALDVGSAGEGALFPPVSGIVPDAVAVDRPVEETKGRPGDER
ncbi:hypothetical protein NX794_14465 [Streptomyces sp. LP11]|uniref:SseB protein N-terminal domain-containing protein n=1 Tax=Streptomyces pyxinicus TaxID=2970331 RepID=A0ABT2B1U1_9ACTN|nr:hypothetical protein [Streptomyces sp. LP11]MCS0602405.1 hypothetical protein [Streptomyces sp. LP11]